jgi:glycosyltransferase involved in cell wall biosynthesis
MASLNSIITLKILKTKLKAILQILSNIIYCCKNYDWVLITDGGKWSINDDVNNLAQYLSSENISSRISSRPIFTRSKVIYFSNLWSFDLNFNRYCTYNKVIVTVFHGDFNIEDEMDKKLNDILISEKLIDVLVVPNLTMKTRFLNWGFSEEKIQVIPIGIIQDIHKPKVVKEFPTQEFTIGSFQKDGIGWEDGLLPKYIKGPDIMVEVLRELKKRGYNFNVRLTGPSRGYVKQKLTEYGIKYHHTYYQNSLELPKEYKKIDLYLMTSREEGGPKSLAECMASLTPFIATPTGLAKDLPHDFNDFISTDFTVEAILTKIEAFLSDKTAQAKFKNIAEQQIINYSMPQIGLQYISLTK